MKNIDYSDFFSSYNNAFDLNPDDHKMNTKDLCEKEDRYLPATDDLIKAFSSHKITRRPSNPENEYERDCYLMPYIYSYQSLLSPRRIRSSSAPIPIAGLSALRDSRSQLDVQRMPFNASTNQLPLAKTDLSSLSSSSLLSANSDEHDAHLDDHAWIPRNRALTVPLADFPFTNGFTFE